MPEVVAVHVGLHDVDCDLYDKLFSSAVFFEHGLVANCM